MPLSYEGSTRRTNRTKKETRWKYGSNISMIWGTRTPWNSSFSFHCLFSFFTDVWLISLVSWCLSSSLCSWVQMQKNKLSAFLKLKKADKNKFKSCQQASTKALSKHKKYLSLSRSAPFLRQKSFHPAVCRSIQNKHFYLAVRLNYTTLTSLFWGRWQLSTPESVFENTSFNRQMQQLQCSYSALLFRLRVL